MLIIKRKAQDSITIAPQEGFDTSRPVSELFEGEAITITMLEVGRRQVKVAVNAPPNLQIWRGDRTAAADNNPDATGEGAPEEKQ